MPQLTSDDIRQVVRELFRGLLEKGEEHLLLAPEDPSISMMDELAGMQAEQEAFKQMLLTRKYDCATQAAAEIALDKFGLKISSKAGEDYDALCQGVLRARLESYRILVAKMLGEMAQTTTTDPMFTGIEIGSLPPLPGEPPQKSTIKLVSELAAEYVAFKSKGEWVQKTKAENQRVLDIFKAVVGSNRTIQSISAEDIKTYRNALLALPANYMKSPEWKDKPITEVIASDTASAKLSAKTASKYLANIRSFLHWCIDQGDLEAMPGPKIKTPKVDSWKTARDPFTDQQLGALFNSPIYRGHITPGRRTKPGKFIIKDGRYWIPLIGLFSGMRLGEIVQLLIEDIREDQGIAFFDISKSEGEDKQIKTSSSIRRVPIHPKLIEMGFLQYFEGQKLKSHGSKGARVFPDIEKGSDGYYSHNFSKWFGRYLIAIDIKTKKTAFHSLRHNFKDALTNANVEESRRMMLMGHKDTGTHSGYGSQTLPLETLFTAIAAISYKVDWSHLINSNAKS